MSWSAKGHKYLDYGNNKRVSWRCSVLISDYQFGSRTAFSFNAQILKVEKCDVFLLTTILELGWITA